MRVESSTLIRTDVHTHDNDISDAECEPIVESTRTTFSYPLSSQPWEFFTVIHQVVSDFFSFSGCLEICHESSVPEFVACPTRHHMSYFRFVRSHA